MMTRFSHGDLDLKALELLFHGRQDLWSQANHEAGHRKRLFRPLTGLTLGHAGKQQRQFHVLNRGQDGK